MNKDRLEEFNKLREKMNSSSMALNDEQKRKFIEKLFSSANASLQDDKDE